VKLRLTNHFISCNPRTPPCIYRYSAIVSGFSVGWYGAASRLDISTCVTFLLIPIFCTVAIRARHRDVRRGGLRIRILRRGIKSAAGDLSAFASRYSVYRACPSIRTWRITRLRLRACVIPLQSCAAIYVAYQARAAWRHACGASGDSVLLISTSTGHFEAMPTLRIASDIAWLA